MKKTYRLQDIAKTADINSESIHTKTALKKQFIWQHLAQKKIKRAIKAKLKINPSKD